MRNTAVYYNSGSFSIKEENDLLCYILNILLRVVIGNWIGYTWKMYAVNCSLSNILHWFMCMQVDMIMNMYILLLLTEIANETMLL